MIWLGVCDFFHIENRLSFNDKPPLTFPLVAMAEVDRPVIPVIVDESKMMTQVRPVRGGKQSE